MSVKGGPDIITDGLVFHLDAAARSKSYPVDGLDVEYLVVAGGGAAAGTRCGGGGAGGLIHGYEQLTISSGTYPITVGAGGSRGSNYGVGARGGDSYLSDLVACSGGGGGSYYTSRATSGGSGGGQGHKCCGIVRASGVEGQGNAGGLGEWAYGCGGGGGAGELGGNGKNTSPNRAGKGGDGLPFDIEGYTKYYAGGGAGGAFSFDSFDYSPGGLGGGATSAGAGETNTGGGGGGLFYSATGSQGNGGSGIVVIRYKGPRKATGGDSIYYNKGYTVHVFTSSGNFVVGDRVGGTSTNKAVGELKNMGSSNYNSGNKGYWTFDGSNEYIDYGDILNIGIGDASIGGWVIRTGGDGSLEWVFSKSIATGATGRYWLDFNNFNRLRFGIAWGTGAHTEYYSLSNISTNTWYHYFISIDRSDALRIYINGILNNSYSISANSSINLTNSLPFRIGAYTLNDGSQSPGYFLHGKVAQHSHYNRVLSPTEILDNYNATKGRFGL